MSQDKTVEKLERHMAILDDATIGRAKTMDESETMKALQEAIKAIAKRDELQAQLSRVTVGGIIEKLRDTIIQKYDSHIDLGSDVTDLATAIYKMIKGV